MHPERGHRSASAIIPRLLQLDVCLTNYVTFFYDPGELAGERNRKGSEQNCVPVRETRNDAKHRLQFRTLTDH